MVCRPSISLASQQSNFVPEPVSAHIPDLKTMDSVLDLLSACNLGILSNALDFRTYTHPTQEADEPLQSEEKLQMDLFDLNSMPNADRVECTFSRGFALDLIRWFAENYVLSKGQGRGTSAKKSESGKLITESIIMDNLAHQAYSVFLAKKKAALEQVVGAPNCTVGKLKTQLLGALPLAASKKFMNLLQTKQKIEEMYMDWNGWVVQPVEKSDTPVVCNKQEQQSLKIWNLGMSSLDHKYAKGISVKFAVNSLQETSKFFPV